MTESENVDIYNDYIKELSFKNLINKDRNLSYWGNYNIRVYDILKLYKFYKPGYKFLDLGSGAGQVLLFAKNIGYEVTGVEFNKELAELDKNTIHKDVRQLDKEFYKNFDVIYTYGPLKDKVELQKYLGVVIDNMKIGGILLTPYFKVNNKGVHTQSIYTHIKYK